MMWMAKQKLYPLARFWQRCAKTWQIDIAFKRKVASLKLSDLATFLIIFPNFE
jgi:hypothetical protein